MAEPEIKEACKALPDEWARMRCDPTYAINSLLRAVRVFGDVSMSLVETLRSAAIGFSDQAGAYDSNIEAVVRQRNELMLAVDKVTKQLRSESRRLRSNPPKPPPSGPNPPTSPPSGPNPPTSPPGPTLHEQPVSAGATIESAAPEATLDELRARYEEKKRQIEAVDAELAKSEQPAGPISEETRPMEVDQGAGALPVLPPELFPPAAAQPPASFGEDVELPVLPAALFDADPSTSEEKEEVDDFDLPGDRDEW